MNSAERGARLCLALFRSNARPVSMYPYMRRTSRIISSDDFEADQYRSSVARRLGMTEVPSWQHVNAMWATRSMASRTEEHDIDVSDGVDVPHSSEDFCVTQAVRPVEPSRQGMPGRRCSPHESRPGPMTRASTTVDWVAHVLAPGVLEGMDRRLMTQALQSITHMLSVAFHPASPKHQIPVMRRQSDVLKSTLDPQLPIAIAMLIAQADELAGHSASTPLQLHPPIALKLVTDLLYAAPPSLLRSVIAKQQAARALSSLLHVCSTSKKVLRNSKCASMIFLSLVSLRHRNILHASVSKACHGILGRVRGTEVSNYDLPAIEGLCSLIVQFRKNPEQKLPRAWWAAMWKIEVVASEGTLPFSHAARIAECVAMVGKPPKPAIQAALMESAAYAARNASNQNMSPMSVSQFLDAAVRLEISSIDTELSKSLFVQGLRQARQCKLDQTMSMLASLRCLGVQLSSHEMKLANQQILRHLEGATIVETLRFLHAANQIQLPLGDRFVTAATKNIAAGLNRDGSEPNLVREAYQALRTISKASHEKSQDFLNF